MSRKLNASVRAAVDATFGEGYADKNPDVVAAFVAAATADRVGETADRTVADLGWPDLLTTARAVAFTGRSRHILLRAVRNRELEIAGQHGRTYIFRRVVLERWLLGISDEDDGPTAPIVSISTARRPRAPLSDSLRRIREAAGRRDDR